MFFGCGSFFLYTAFSIRQTLNKRNYEELVQSIHNNTDVSNLQELLLFELNYTIQADNSSINILFVSGGLLIISSIVILYLLRKLSKVSDGT